MYGFIDESGSPGVKISDIDYLGVSLVIFDDVSSEEKLMRKMHLLRKRLGLSEDYEFHRSHNSRRVQKEFTSLLGRANLSFISVLFRKDDFKNSATYAKIANTLVSEIREKYSGIKIIMDKNPTLFQAIRREARLQKMKLGLSDGDSKRVDLLQVADYLVGISVDYAKGAKYGAEDFAKIASKEMGFTVKNETIRLGSSRGA
ncbi:DUF3800 domain-containing protein [Candidatus Saccharibacteria bacterium]|nr:DUF3800 domain-containing protein [Candidatus Saccharibacteria bacterium]